MRVLRFKGPDYIKQLDKSSTDDFRFLKQPHTKISKNMKRIKFFNYLFRKFIEFIKIEIINKKTNIINYIKFNIEFTDFITIDL